MRESVIAFTFGLMILTMRMRFSYPDFYECTLSSDPFNFGLNLIFLNLFQYFNCILIEKCSNLMENW